MDIFLYNTLSKEKEKFIPVNKNKVGVYTCGPTVYDYSHIGNLRAYIFADILKRVLRYNFFEVNHIINITDVGHLTSDADQGEDKMMKALYREGLPLSVNSLKKLSKKYTDAFIENLKDLNILLPDKWTVASEYIPQMIEFIKKIQANGYVYENDLALYFDISKLKDYSKLSGQEIAEKIIGAREEVEIDKGKKNPADFVLWFKLAGKNKNHLMRWLSPWGEGFPGWHIECSAMSVAELGENIDIHTGGIDHIPVHHTNERAQNIGACGQEVVKRWIHNEFLVLDKAKMAKSADTFITLNNFKKQGIAPLAYRYFCLNTHYRQQLQYGISALQSAQKTLTNLKNFLMGIKSDNYSGCEKYEHMFLEAVNDDLNIPRGLGIMWQMIDDDNFSSPEKKNSILKFDEILGLNLHQSPKIPKSVIKLGEQRQKARRNKDWGKADSLRAEIEKMGYKIEDVGDNFVIKLL